MFKDDAKFSRRKKLAAAAAVVAMAIGGIAYTSVGTANASPRGAAPHTVNVTPPAIRNANFVMRGNVCYATSPYGAMPTATQGKASPCSTGFYRGRKYNVAE